LGYTVPVEQLRELYRALLTDRPEIRKGAGAAIIRDIARDGWAFEWQVEDLMALTDRRLDGYLSAVKLERVGQVLGLTMQSICYRPNSRTSSVGLHRAWNAVDFASLLIALEMLGFAVDPAPLVAELRPAIPTKGYITSAALDVLWHTEKKQRGRIIFQREDCGGPIGAEKAHVLAGGYKLLAMLDPDGEPMSLSVRGPKFRKEREPVEVKCDQCGLTWWRGDRESSASHRKNHRQRMAAIKPQVNDAVRPLISNTKLCLHVDWQSPRWLHKEMHSRAYAFQRELGYDFVQWDCPERDKDAHGFLFADSDGRILGACAFRLRDDKIGGNRWGLQWIWIAPPHRRSGVLRSRWSTLRERFGNFKIEYPVSEAMQAFVNKVGDPHLL
jgi:hypothetical protein